MKAILRIGQFSTMVDLPERRPDIYVFAPTNLPLSMMASETLKPDPATAYVKKWRFSYVKELEDNIYLYEFMGES